MHRYIPREHATVLAVIPTPRIKIPEVKRKRYESRKMIKTQSRGHVARRREHCAPSTRIRREIRWLTTETPNRYTMALMIAPWPIVVGLSSAGFETGGKRRQGERTERFSTPSNLPEDDLYSTGSEEVEPRVPSFEFATDNEMADFVSKMALNPTMGKAAGVNLGVLAEERNPA